MDKDLIFESFRRCITEPKCVGCKWESCGKIINGHPLRIPEIRIPVDLALAVCTLMAEQLYENKHEIVHCKDCKHRTKRVCNKIELWECNHIRYELVKCGVTDEWFCADGERK